MQHSPISLVYLSVSSAMLQTTRSGMAPCDMHDVTEEVAATKLECGCRYMLGRQCVIGIMKQRKRK